MAAFDEKAYLIANPDVAHAVETGAIETGLAHYEAFGRSEERPLDPSQTRKGRMLADLNVAAMSGVEIGALAAPLVKKAEGLIRYVDHAPTEEIIAKYANDPTVPTKDIVPVDAVWGGNSLQQALGTFERYDYVLASHVIEHVPDLITWLQEIKDILKISGVLRLAVPDKRFEFDYLRGETTLSDVIDAHVRRARQPLPRMIIDFHTFVNQINVHDAWRDIKPERKDWAEGCRLGISLARETLASGAYHDVHCWVFTPKVFGKIMAQCAELGLLHFKCESFYDTARQQLEFIVGLVPCEDEEACVESWSKMVSNARE